MASVTHQVLLMTESSANITDPYFANVRMLLGFDGADGSTGAPGMTDQSPNANGTFTDVAGATISTAQSVFGGSSFHNNGSGEILNPNTDVDFQFGTAAFTVEFRAYPTTSTGTQFFCGKWNNAPNLGWVVYQSNLAVRVNLSTTGSDNLNPLASSTNMTQNAWNAICWDFDGTTHRLYLDGVMRASTTTSYNIFASTLQFAVGGGSGGSFKYTGYIDELRITQGVARYASDGGYTVATAAFPRS